MSEATFRIKNLELRGKNYEEERFLGSGDSHSDSRTDGGTDRTGNNLMYGNGTAFLSGQIRNEE